MHGGAKGSGAPLGNSNALTYGLFTKEIRDRRRAAAQLMRDAKKMLSDIE